MKNELMKMITKEHKYLRQWLRGDSRRTGCLMLDTSDGEVWADCFLSENDWKVYKSESIIHIPINDIEYMAIKDRPLKISELDQAIYEWCLEKIKENGGDEEREGRGCPGASGQSAASFEQLY